MGNRRVQGAGLQAAYSDPDNRELKDGVHMLLSLAFVPVEDLPATFEVLREELVDDLLAIADDFEKTYIQVRRPRRAANPRRAPSVRPRYSDA